MGGLNWGAWGQPRSMSANIMKFSITRMLLQITFHLAQHDTQCRVVSSSYPTHHRHHHHHTNIIKVSYSEQLREHWTRLKQRDTNATVWQSRQGPRRGTFSSDAWKRMSLKSPWRRTETRSRRERRPPGRNGCRLSFYALAEPPVRAKMLTTAAVLCRCRPRDVRSCSSSDRYAGAVPCRQRKTSTESLNSIRSDTCSQWRSRSSGVMCSNCELLSFSSVNLWFDLNYIHYKMH